MFNLNYVNIKIIYISSIIEPVLSPNLQVYRTNFYEYLIYFANGEKVYNIIYQPSIYSIYVIYINYEGRYIGKPQSTNNKVRMLLKSIQYVLKF